VDLKQIASFDGFVAEEIKLPVSLVDDGVLKPLIIGLDDLVNFL
jgi:hypothetical protein